MTIRQKLKERPEIQRLSGNLSRGEIDLLEASKRIIEWYDDGTLDYESAQEAIRMLIRIKVK